MIVQASLYLFLSLLLAHSITFSMYYGLDQKELDSLDQKEHEQELKPGNLIPKANDKTNTSLKQSLEIEKEIKKPVFKQELVSNLLKQPKNSIPHDQLLEKVFRWLDFDQTTLESTKTLNPYNRLFIIISKINDLSNTYHLSNSTTHYKNLLTAMIYLNINKQVSNEVWQKLEIAMLNNFIAPKARQIQLCRWLATVTN
ncbi:MAG TPA: hypothetical protein VHA52_12140 [Candidatus Babeliaceae bacterium]|nr:hypothetical protein [Candidatus Babeliaceae bacterium]